MVPDPEERAKFLLAEIVVSPLKEIEPVPVEVVPDPETEKFPEAWVYPVIPESTPAVETSRAVDSI